MNDLDNTFLLFFGVFVVLMLIAFIYAICAIVCEQEQQRIKERKLLWKSK